MAQFFQPVNRLICISLIAAANALAEPGLRLNETPATLSVDTGFIKLDVDRRTGFIRQVDCMGRKVAENGALFLDLIRARDHNARENRLDGEALTGSASPTSCRMTRQDDDVLIETTGTFLNGDVKTKFRSAIETKAGAPWLRVRIELDSPPGDQALFVRQAGFAIAMNLDEPPVRVAIGGDRGIAWDTPARYEVFLDGKSAKIPDICDWGLWAVLQDAPNHYRMWKAESERTSSLTMMEGKLAPGWMDLSDDRGGMTMACREMAGHAPAEILCDTRNGGRLVFFLHPPHVRALDLRPLANNKSNPATAAFRASRELVMYFHEDPWRANRSDQDIARLWDLPRFANDEPIQPYPASALAGPPMAEGADSAFVSSGIPFPRGEMTSTENLRLMEGDKEIPVQAQPLAYWPDGSLKWVLLTAPLDSAGIGIEPGSGKGSTIPLHLNTRLKEDRQFILHYGKNVRKGAVKSALKASLAGESGVIDTGRLRFAVKPGEGGFFDEVSLDGKPVVLPASAARHFLEYVHTSNPPPVCASSVQGERDTGRCDVVEGVIIEESGPLRATVLVRGKHQNMDQSEFAMRYQAFANRTYVRAFHTFTYAGADNRRSFVSALGLRLPLELGSERRVTAGGEQGAIALTGARGGLDQNSYLNYEAWQAHGNDFAAEIIQRGERSSGWLDISDGKRGCACVMRNMWADYPKELAADLRSGELTAYLWPRSANVLDMRVYSDFHHMASGESTWYRGTKPGQPFIRNTSRFAKGVSRTHELLYYFHAGDAASAPIERVAADFDKPAFLYVTPEWYAGTKVLGNMAAPDFKKRPRLEQNLCDVLDFVLMQQKFWGWFGMIDYGDWRHRQGTIFGKNFLPENQWNYDFGRWGWSNTEGLPSRFLHLQFMRTGNREYYFAGEAMARHNRDVDIYRDGPFAFLGTRHGVNHWSDGYKDERIAIASEFRFDYLLRGDSMSRDMISNLVEKRDLAPGRPRNDWMLARPGDLIAMWELTGEARYGEVLKNIAHACIATNGVGTEPRIEMPSGKKYAPPDNINGRTMFFHYFGPMYALMEYCELTGDPEMTQALLRMWRSDSFLGGRQRPGPLPLYAFAAQHETDPALRQKAVAILRDVCRFPGGRADFVYSSSTYNITLRRREDWMNPPPGPWAISGQFFFPNAAPYVFPFVDGE